MSTAERIKEILDCKVTNENPYASCRIDDLYVQCPMCRSMTRLEDIKVYVNKQNFKVFTCDTCEQHFQYRLTVQFSV